jgi:excisionase family DNA binding protein
MCNGPLLTVSEAAGHLNTSVRFVCRLVAERRVALHHVGRHLRFLATDLDAFIAAGWVKPITRSSARDVRRAA